MNSNRSCSVSIIIPARNEKNYIESLVKRLPLFPADFEVIFIEGHSTDNTLDEIKRISKIYGDKIKIRYARQDGIGKADAVWNGFNLAENEILMIFDSDMTVAPEDLMKFYEAINKDKNLFINGTRMIYKMEKDAMRPLNWLGNKLFAFLLSLVLRRKLTDTLCGTKVISRENFSRLKQLPLFNRLRDPYCDFTLLIGAKELKLKIVEVPVVYQKRIYGQTKIRRFRDAWKLLKMVISYLGHEKLLR